MLSVAVVGASGYVGSALALTLESSGKFKVSQVVRANYSQAQKQSYDVLINTAMPSKRFWAKSHPEEDFKETVEKTEILFKEWHYKKFVHISTVSARCETNTVYGRHKAEAEKKCSAGDALIVRLSAMFSQDLSKGSLIDILNGNKVFVSGESRYPFASLDFVTSWIAGNLHRQGIVEVGAKNSISLQEIAKYLSRSIEFEGPVEDQTLQDPSSDFPNSNEVLKFMDQMIKAGNP